MAYSKYKTALIVIIALIMIVALGMATVLHGKTIIEWWKPLLPCSVISVFVAAALFRPVRYIIGIKNFVINALCAFAVAFPIVIGIFYSLNYYCSDASTRHDVKATVVRKYSKERYRTKRVSRNHVTRGEKYHVYYADIELPDGKV